MEVNRLNMGASRLTCNGSAPASGMDCLEVSVITGEDLVNMSGMSRMDLVKIDVEGHEASVLTSLSPAIRRFRPRAILFESQGDLSEEHPVVQLLTSLEYKISGVAKRLNGWRLVPWERCGLLKRKPNDYVASLG